MSWVSINDVAEIILHIINSETLSGPINIVSPNPLSNYSFTKILGKKLHRPTLFPLPAFLANLLFGEMAQELLLSSTKVIPLKLQKSGYHFQESTLESALDDILNIQ